MVSAINQTSPEVAEPFKKIDEVFSLAQGYDLNSRNMSTNGLNSEIRWWTNHV